MKNTILIEDIMTHSYDTGIAKVVGVEAAAFLNHLFFWIQKNYGNGKHYYDGSYWTYNSVRGFNIIFDYLKPKQINRILRKLVDDKYIKTGNYNESKMDRTMWYAFTEKGLKLMEDNGYKLGNNDDLPKKENAFTQNGKMHLPKRENAFAQKGKCTYTDISNTDISNTDILPTNVGITYAHEAEENQPQVNTKTKELDSTIIEAAGTPYGKFLSWLKDKAPYCYKNLQLPTEAQFNTLVSKYGSEKVANTVLTIENRKDYRKKYVNLYLTVNNWLRRDEEKTNKQ